MKKAVLIGAVLMLALPAMAQELQWTITEDAGMYKVIGKLVFDVNINAIDVGTASAPGLISAAVDGAALYQDWPWDMTPASDYRKFANYLASPTVDTHFLFATNTMTIPSGRELAEDNDFSTGGSAGWGTYLAGTFGIAPAAQNTTLDFVQLYATAGWVDYNIAVGSAGNPTTTFVGSVYVPEPTTIALLGLGAVGLLKRRRNA